MIKHIHIITLTNQELSHGYVISQLAECWRSEGILVTTGPLLNVNADIGILHVDSTRVPQKFLAANLPMCPVLNSKLLDISKRRISRRLLDEDSPYSGPVIIKTDANCFGKREFKQLSKFSFKRLRQKLTKRISWKILRELPWNNYPVLKSKTDVPGWVWKRKDLVVEQFSPEMENGEYVLRVWLFLGDMDYVLKMVSKEPVVKAGNIIRREILQTVPDALRKVRAEMQIDYGKFDYVEVDGEVVLLDVNKTPTTSSRGAPSENLIRVARGIMYYGETKL